jgi:hypothetical protein
MEERGLHARSAILNLTTPERGKTPRRPLPEILVRNPF